MQVIYKGTIFDRQQQTDSNDDKYKINVSQSDMKRMREISQKINFELFSHDYSKEITYESEGLQSEMESSNFGQSEELHLEDNQRDFQINKRGSLLDNIIQKTQLNVEELNLVSFKQGNSVDFYDDPQFQTRETAHQLLHTQSQQKIQNHHIRSISNLTSKGQLDYSPQSHTSHNEKYYNQSSQRTASVDDISLISRGQQQSQDSQNFQMRQASLIYNCQIEDLQRKLQNVLVENQKLTLFNENLTGKKESLKLEGPSSSLYQQLKLVKYQMHEISQKLFEAENQVVCKKSSELATVEIQSKKIEDQQKSIQTLIQQNEEFKTQLIQKNLQNEMHLRDNSILQNQILQFQQKEVHHKSILSLQCKEQQQRLNSQEEIRRKELQDMMRQQQQLLNQHTIQVAELKDKNEMLLQKLHKQDEKENSQNNNLLKQINQYRQEIEYLKITQGKSDQEIQLYQKEQEQNNLTMKKYEKDRRSTDVLVLAQQQKIKQLEEKKQYSQQLADKLLLELGQRKQNDLTKY